KKQRANLLETLAAYFSHNEDINTTAEALFVHPNTVRYRLERAAKLLARDLNLAEDRFQLYLALKITSLYPFAGAEKNNNKI
ncbi:MAG: helix-turn-helix domain-containing protein, partial [Bacillota bacterium]|nr:helix-turn-helix domain-containing protein [Bacillota bacterium]